MDMAVSAIKQAIRHINSANPITGAGAGAEGGIGVDAGADETLEVAIISTLVTGVGKINYRHTYDGRGHMLKCRVHNSHSAPYI